MLDTKHQHSGCHIVSAQQLNSLLPVFSIISPIVFAI